MQGPSYKFPIVCMPAEDQSVLDPHSEVPVWIGTLALKSILEMPFAWWESDLQVLIIELTVWRNKCGGWKWSQIALRNCWSGCTCTPACLISINEDWDEEGVEFHHCLIWFKNDCLIVKSYIWCPHSSWGGTRHKVAFRIRRCLRIWTSLLDCVVGLGECWLVSCGRPI